MDFPNKQIKGPLGRETPYAYGSKSPSKPSKTKVYADLGGRNNNNGQCGRQSLPVSFKLM